MGELRVLLGDDHTVLRHGLRKILEERRDWHVVGEAGNGRDAVREALALTPDVAVLDIGMPLLNGIEATRQIVRRYRVLGGEHHDAVIHLTASELYRQRAAHPNDRRHEHRKSGHDRDTEDDGPGATQPQRREEAQHTDFEEHGAG